MRAVILAGGEGTRLRPLTLTTPKSLLPICNIPFLEHQLMTLKRHGIDAATLLTGYLADSFGPFIGHMATRGVTLDVSREGKPLGTCGAVRSILDRLEDTTIVFNGDVLTDLDLTGMLASHRSNGASLTIALKPVADAGPYGLVPTGPDGRVQQFLEKPPPEIASKGGEINAGTYMLEPEVLRGVPAGEMWSFERQLFPDLVAAGSPVYGYVSSAYWLDIGTPDRFLQAHWDLIEGLSSFRPDAPKRGEYRYIDDRAMVRGDVQVLLAGPGAIIEAGAIAGPRISMGTGAVIRDGATVRRSVLLDGAVIESGAVVTDSIIGPGAIVGPEKKLTGDIVAAGERI